MLFSLAFLFAFLIYGGVERTTSYIHSLDVREGNACSPSYGGCGGGGGALFDMSEKNN